MGVGALAGRRDQTRTILTPPENEPKDEGFASDGSKNVTLVREPRGKVMRKGEKILGNIIYVKKYYVCSSLEGEDPEGAPHSGQISQRIQRRGGKKIFFPRKVKMFGFGCFPREIFALFTAKQEVSFTKPASYATQVKPNPKPFVHGPGPVGDAGGSRKAALGDRAMAGQQGGPEGAEVARGGSEGR